MTALSQSPGYVSPAAFTVRLKPLFQITRPKGGGRCLRQLSATIHLPTFSTFLSFPPSLNLPFPTSFLPGISTSRHQQPVSYTLSIMFRRIEATLPADASYPADLEKLGYVFSCLGVPYQERRRSNIPTASSSTTRAKFAGSIILTANTCTTTPLTLVTMMSFARQSKVSEASACEPRHFVNNLQCASATKSCFDLLN